ncbi:hypothetical protein DFH08DRAFT_894859 [Mycena albidolilacea]|uniref:Transmembrane protein n=1 Tax=Mycena albidolilacea TaxID=1033008 RepID=A0AAD6ZAY7_9AGAR|nr:hypothetical protein DFH08DRAFT_894859 [Mycena albidolilacea]
MDDGLEDGSAMLRWRRRWRRCRVGRGVRRRRIVAPMLEARENVGRRACARRAWKRPVGVESSVEHERGTREDNAKVLSSILPLFLLPGFPRFFLYSFFHHVKVHTPLVFLPQCPSRVALLSRRRREEGVRSQGGKATSLRASRALPWPSSAFQRGTYLRVCVCLCPLLLLLLTLSALLVPHILPSLLSPYRCRY